MIDPLSMAVGAGLVGVGVVAGRFWRPARAESRVPHEYFCGCEHALSFHDPETGRCHGIIRNYSTDFESVECTCRHYDGPPKLDSIDWSSIQLPSRGSELERDEEK